MPSLSTAFYQQRGGGRNFQSVLSHCPDETDVFAWGPAFAVVKTLTTKERTPTETYPEHTTHNMHRHTHTHIQGQTVDELTVTHPAHNEGTRGPLHEARRLLPEEHHPLRHAHTVRTRAEPSPSSSSSSYSCSSCSPAPPVRGPA